MTNTRFIDLVRQYASLARRTRRSYADVVNVLVQMRKESLNNEEKDSEKLGVARRVAESIAVREYGKFDEKFSLTETD